MTIDEAILILEPSENRPMFLDKAVVIEAVKLGIEALKRIKHQRSLISSTYKVLLTGETEK